MMQNVLILLSMYTDTDVGKTIEPSPSMCASPQTVPIEHATSESLHHSPHIECSLAPMCVETWVPDKANIP